MNRILRSGFYGVFVLLAVCQSAESKPVKNKFQNSTAPTSPALPATNDISVPVNQVLRPAGLQVELPGMRPQVIALSPDGAILLTSGKTAELIVIDPRSGRIL